MIQRAIYLRDGQPRGVTFGGDLVDTAAFVELWERMAKCTVIAVVPARQEREVLARKNLRTQAWQVEP